MKLKKILILILIIISVYFIYTFFKDKKINYIALGDSLAQGVTPYDQIGYSYADFVKDYLKSKERLKFYTKNYAKSGYSTGNIIEDISSNKTIVIDGKKYNIRKALRESSLVTLSIGANDLIKEINLSTNITSIYPKLDLIFIDIKNTIKEIEKYAKGYILVIGYYNPNITKDLLTENQADVLFKYIDQKYNEICTKPKTSYISIYNVFKNNDYLPNPNNVHPNINGYVAISKEITNFIENSTKLLAN